MIERMLDRENSSLSSLLCERRRTNINSWMAALQKRWLVLRGFYICQPRKSLEQASRLCERKN